MYCRALRVFSCAPRRRWRSDRPRLPGGRPEAPKPISAIIPRRPSPSGASGRRERVASGGGGGGSGRRAAGAAPSGRLARLPRPNPRRAVAALRGLGLGLRLRPASARLPAARLAFSFVVAASFEIRKRLATERPAELVHLASASRGVAVPRRWAVAPEYDRSRRSSRRSSPRIRASRMRIGSRRNERDAIGRDPGSRHDRPRLGAPRLRPGARLGLRVAPRLE